MNARLNKPSVRLLSLAAAASLLELGPIAALLYQGQGILPVLAAGLAYQIGNAAPRPTMLSRRKIIGVAAVVGAILLLSFEISTPLGLLGIALLSWALQAVRRSVVFIKSEQPSTAQKRIARVGGFIVATLVPITVWLTLVLLMIAMALPTKSLISYKGSRHKVVLAHPLEWTMLVHQIHYFAYAYAVPVLVAQPILGGVPLTGFWFACGWISYLSAETLWRRFPPKPTFIVGHLCLTIILLMLTVMNYSPWATAVLWILSGFGGGTVYCLTLLHERNNLSHANLERAEDVGHLLGVSLALACVYFLNWNAGQLPALGSIWAFVAALAMIAMSYFHFKSGYLNPKPQGGEDAGQ